VAYNWAYVRWPHLAVILGLVALSFMQVPGRITFDTKLDLSEDPVGFLDRARTLWNPQGSFGELQNQAYGYLFPIGPFFALGEAVGLPPWIVQRIWVAALLVLAYTGVVLVCRSLPVGTRSARIIAGLAYALSPRVVTTLGPISAETLVLSLLPWTVVPVLLWQRWGLRRAAALSGLGVLAMGGANATLVLSVLPLTALVVLAQPSGIRARVAGWWALAVACACAWWAGALLVLGRYSPQFLDHIEAAVNTSAAIGPAEAVRGATHWVSWVAVGADPWWPAGYAVSTTPWLVVATTVVGAAGLLALLDPRVPLRSAWLLSALIGLVVLTLGWDGPLGGPLADGWRGLLDGPLNPFRNVHKFDPLIRLPAAIGLAHLLGRLLGAPLKRDFRSVVKITAAGGVAACVLATLVPAVSPGLRTGPGWTDIPQWWRDAAEFVADHDALARTLVLPSTGFGTQVWGRTVDEPMQALAEAPWVSRNQVFLGSAGAARLVEGLDRWTESGRGSPALGDILARAGVRFVIVRGDLEPRRSGTPLASVIRQALERSGGITRVAEFGPTLTGGGAAGLRVLGFGLDAGVPAIEIYEVDRPVSPVSVVALDDITGVTGGPESIPRLIEDRLLHPDAPAILAADDRGLAQRWLITDDMPRRERHFGRIRDNRGPVLTADEDVRLTRAVNDIVPPGAEDHYAVARYTGITGVSASTARGYVDSVRPTDVAMGPWAAVDGDLYTAWRSDSGGQPIGEWLRVDLPAPKVMDHISVRFVDSPLVGSRVTAVDVHTESGVVRHPVRGDGWFETLAVPEEPTAFVRIEIAAVDGDPIGEVGIVEMRLPDIHPDRIVVAPFDQSPSSRDAGAPDGMAFHRLEPTRSACIVVDFSIRCDPNQARRGDEPTGLVRGFTTTAPASYYLYGTVLPRPGSGVFELLEPLSGLTASASSTRGGVAAVAAQRAVDGNPSTSWVAGSFDAEPTLELTWPEERPVSAAHLSSAQHPVATRPTTVVIEAGGEHWERRVVDGWVRFPEVVTDELTIRITGWTPMWSSDPGGAGPTPVSPGIAEVEIPGLEDLVVAEDLDVVTGRFCGSGPEVIVDGTRVETAVVGTIRDVVDHRPLRWYACGEAAHGVPVGRGQHVVEVRADEMFAPDTAVFRRVFTSRPGVADAGTAEIKKWGRTSRTVGVVTTEPALIIVPESFNEGWVAYLNGAELPSVRMDGWQQGWELPAGVDGDIEIEFVPQRHFVAALGLGAVAAVGLIGLAVMPGRQFPQPALPAEARTARLRSRRAATVLGAVTLGGVVAGVVGAALFAATAVLRLTGRWLAVAAGLVAAVAIGGVGAAQVVPGEFASLVRTAATLPVVAFVAAGALRALTGDRTEPAVFLSRWRRQRPWVLVAHALIVLQLGWRAWGLSESFFWQDDFVYLHRASQGLSLEYLLQDYNGQLMPGQFGLVWLVTSIAPMNWPLAGALVLLLQLVASVLVLRLIRAVAGDGPLSLIAFAVYVVSPIVFTATIWWASALQTLPLQICLAWALLAHLRYLRGGSGRHVLSAVSAIVVGVLFWHQAILTGPALVAFTVLVAPILTGRQIRQLVRRSRAALLAYLTVAAAAAAGWLIFAEPRPSQVTPGEFGELLRVSVLETFVPALFGLMVGSEPFAPLLAPGSYVVVAVVSSLIVVGALVAAVRAAGWIAVAPVLLLCGYLVADIGLLAATGLDFIGPMIGRDPRYTAEAVVIAAVCLAGIGAAVRARRDRLRQDLWRARRPWAGAVVALVVVGSLVSTAAVVARLPMGATRDYIATARDTSALLSGIDLADGPVPEFVMSPLLLDEARSSVAVGALQDEFRFHRPTRDLRILDEFGRPRPVEVRRLAGTEPAAEDDACPWPIRQRMAALPLDAPLPEGDWVVEVSYYSGAPTTGRLEIGTRSVDVEFLAGVHHLYLELPDTAVDAAVSVGELARGDAVCVTGVAVGMVGSIEGR
jgi:arabinofuranan 3-O-arabinosyltransferase